MPPQIAITGTTQDAERLRLLRSTELLDSPAEESFDRLTRLVCTLADLPVALISLLDADREFFKSQCGLPEAWASRRSVPLSSSFCQHVVESGEPLIIEDAREDPLFRNNPVVGEMPIVAYAGVPIRLGSGAAMGSLCGIDQRPRSWSAEEIQALEDIAASIATLIEFRLVVAHQSAESAHEAVTRITAQAEERRSAFLAEASTLLSSSLDPEETLVQLADLAVPAIADWCAIDVVDEKGELQRVVVRHPDPAKVEFAQQLHERYPPDPDAATGVFHVMRTGEPELVPEFPEGWLRQAARDEEHFRIIQELNLVSYMVVPLLARGRALGAISFVAAESGRRFDESDLHLAVDLAGRAALAVANARLYSEAERARSQTTRILESITDAFMVIDRDWRFTYINQEGERVLQKKREELLGNTIWELFPEAVGSTFETNYRQAMEKNRTVQFEEFYPPLAAWFDVKVYPADETLSVYFRDISDEKAAQRAVQYSELRFRSLIEATAAIVWNTPATGTLDGDQPGWAAFTGQTPEEYQGAGWVEMIHPEDRERTARIWTEAIQNRSMYEAEHRVRRHDGVYRHMLARAIPIVSDSGEVLEWVGIHSDLTPLRQAQEELEYQSYITRTITENATPALFMMNEKGQCTYMNRAAEEMIGFELDEIRDISLHDAIHHHRPDGTPYPMSECPIDRALPEDFSVRAHPDVFIRKDGTYFPVMCAASPIFDRSGKPIGTVVEVRDITEERRAEAEREKLLKELSAERAKLHGVFQAAPAVIALYSGPEHTITMVNQTFRDVVGRDDILGRPFREAFAETEQAGLFELLDRVYHSGEAHVGDESWIPLRRGSRGVVEDTYWNFVWQPIVNASGEVTDILVHAVEVTAQVEARREVERKAEEITRVARQLEITNRELDQFAYVASHDLKAPLRGIANLSQWIEEDLSGEINQEVQEHLSLMRGRVHRMEGLIDGILEYSRAGRVREEPELLHVDALVRDVIDLLAPPEHIHIEVKIDMPELLTERLPLQQVFMNLIGNAVKYGGGEGSEIRIACREQGSFFRFSVSDTGPGIAPEYHERIFGIFQTLEARDRVEGTGIGLSLVKKIVENRGGEVWVESEPGAGATFHFLWPREN